MSKQEVTTMPRRSKQSQSAHDAEVRRTANEFKQKGFDVKADVPGFTQPDTIGGYRPDVVATSGRQKKIVEVETTESAGSARDRKQQQAFGNAASRAKNTTFTRKIVKK